MKAQSVRETIEQMVRSYGFNCRYEDPEIVCSVPSELGTGSLRYIQLRNDMEILSGDLMFHRDFSSRINFTDSHGELFFVFDGWPIDDEAIVSAYPNGKSSAFFTLNAQYSRSLRMSAGTTHKFLSLHFNIDQWIQLWSSIGIRPAELDNAILDLSPLQEAGEAFAKHLSSCSYSCEIKRLFVESKAIELFLLCIRHVESQKKHRVEQFGISNADMEKIRAAKDIVINRLDSPPSLKELAHLVGTNDFKLKVGFKKVYGTTVFGFLRTERLERARGLLSNPDLLIGQVAQQVGYSNFSHFARAFKDHFGISPKIYKQLHS